MPGAAAAEELDPAAKKSVKALFEAGVRDHGSHALGLWLAYSAWHSGLSEFAMASAVHARALKALEKEHHQDFVEQAIEMSGGIAASVGVP